MFRCSKLLSAFVIFTILFTFAMPVFSITDSSLTVTQKADSLNKIMILKGDGKNYNLDGQLKRSEAATFIIRMLGAESVVYESVDYTTKPVFKDVTSEHWHMPYVMYAYEAGIIDGFGDGTFRPDEFISEKAFLKLVLGVLGYRYNKDFTWNSVYKKAYEVGLLTDSAYIQKTDDNTNYKRQSVVEIIYAALSLNRKDNDKTLLQDLIGIGAVSKEQAKSAGFVYDELPTQISSVDVIGSTSIKIKLNETINKLTANNIQITESANPNNILTSSISSQNENEIILTTAVQKEEIKYVVTLKNVEDTEGNIINDISAEFTGYKSKAITSVYFMTSMVEAVSRDVINVYFTQPINLTAAIPTYYEIWEGNTQVVKGSFNNMNLALIGGTNNGLSIYLKDAHLKEGVEYTLKLSKEIRSKYGASLQDGQGESMTFYGKSIQNDSLYLEGAYTVDKRTVMLQFNRDVDWKSAEISGNYSLTSTDGGTVPILKAKINGEGQMEKRTVYLGLASDLSSEKVYKLTIKKIEDSLQETSINNVEVEIAGTSVEKEKLYIVYVNLIDNGTIEVYFNHPVESTRVTDPTRFTITGLNDSAYGSRNPARVYYNEEKGKEKITLYMASANQLNSNYTYRLTVSNMISDYLYFSSPSDMEFEFTGSSNSLARPEMNNATIISKNQIKVEFTKEILNESPNTDNSNYTLYYMSGDTKKTKSISSVYIYSSNVLVIAVDSLDLAQEYKLEFNSIKDYAGNTFGGSGSTRTVGY